MKLISKINPKQLFRSKKKTRSITRSDPSSFSSTDSPTSVLATTTSSADVAETFKMMDRDGDGKIDLSQLEQILTRIGPDPKEVKLMLTEIDADGDGCISLEELRAAVGSAFDPATAAGHELRDAFAFFDADRDGKITAEELREVFSAVLGDDGCTLEECRRMIAEVGKSGDGGFVCFDDFVRMMELQQR